MSDTTKENKSRRNLKGIILIDKPEGISSFGVVRRVKRILNVRRAGHLGTLDPFATGLLPILLGSATKLFPFLSKLNKRYIGLIELGKRTTTADPTGEIIETHPTDNLSVQEIEQTMLSFVGEFTQEIPIYSAKKIDGKPSYKWARMGIQKTPAPQKGFIKELKIISINIPFIEFELEVSSGTYIRAIAYMLGKKLKTGGILKSLRRISYGKFSIDDAIKIEELENLSLTNRDKILIILPYDALEFMREVVVPSGYVKSVLNGKLINHLPFGFEPEEKELIKLTDNNKNLLAIIEYTPKEKTPYRYKRVFNL